MELGLAVEDLIGAELGGLPEQALRDGDRERGGVDRRVPGQLEGSGQNLGGGPDLARDGQALELVAFERSGPST